MKRTKFSLIAIIGLMTTLIFTSCDQDDEGNKMPDETNETGTANIQATDAAIDAENVTGVFLSVTGIHVDGDDDSNDTTVMFDATEEFNLMAYQNGETYGLGSIDLGVGSYSDISFILDEEMPGYVAFSDDTSSEIELEGSGNEYEILGAFDIEADSQTDLVADVDLRKALVKTSSEGEFMLRSTARLVEANISGTIEGSIENYEAMKTENDLEGTESKVVVFAYTEGSFDESEKEDGSGIEGRFENSINSAVVADDGSFTLAFMEESDYEIVVAVFEKDETEPEEEEFEFSELLETELSAGGSLDLILDGLGVTANSSTTVSIKIGLD
ncbi:MAG: DUF4382 domain-containing protein [Marinoscillum sp.]